MLPTITIVVPCYNEAEGLPEFHRQLTAVLDTLSDYAFGILFVDDGSTDNTLPTLHDLARIDSRVKIASLSRNFGHQTALSAGIDLVDSDALIAMDCDLQHPPEVIPHLLMRWQAGDDIVSTIRRDTSSRWFNRTTSSLFYRLINRLSDTRVIPGAADFCLLSCRAYTALRQMPERHRFLRGMISWLGFPRSYLEFDCPPRFAGRSKYSLRKMIRLASDAILSFSSTPLRLASVTGFFATFAGAAYLAYVLMRHLLVGDLVAGWGSLMATVLFLGGVQLLCLGVASEYIARIYEQVKGRPQYVLKLTPDDARPLQRHRPSSHTLTEQQLLELVTTMRATVAAAPLGAASGGTAQ